MQILEQISFFFFFYHQNRTFTLMHVSTIFQFYNIPITIDCVLMHCLHEKKFLNPKSFVYFYCPSNSCLYCSTLSLGSALAFALPFLHVLQEHGLKVGLLYYKPSYLHSCVPKNIFFPLSVKAKTSHTTRDHLNTFKVQGKV